jgi:hypothetical protein
VNEPWKLIDVIPGDDPGTPIHWTGTDDKYVAVFHDLKDAERCVALAAEVERLQHMHDATMTLLSSTGVCITDPDEGVDFTLYQRVHLLWERCQIAEEAIAEVERLRGVVRAALYEPKCPKCGADYYHTRGLRDYYRCMSHDISANKEDFFQSSQCEANVSTRDGDDARAAARWLHYRFELHDKPIYQEALRRWPWLASEE